LIVGLSVPPSVAVLKYDSKDWMLMFQDLAQKHSAFR